jgi:hypothetical protein
MSCLVRKPLAASRTDCNRGALFVIDTKFHAGILAEIELGKIPVEMLAIDVLINANQPAFEDRKEAFKGVGMNVAVRPFEFGMIDQFMGRDRRKLVARGRIGHQAAVLMHVAADNAHGAAMVQHGRTDIAASFHKADDDGVMGLATETCRTLSLAGTAPVRFHPPPRSCQRRPAGLRKASESLNAGYGASGTKRSSCCN